MEPNAYLICSLASLQMEEPHLACMGLYDIKKVHLMPAFNNSVHDTSIFTNWVFWFTQQFSSLTLKEFYYEQNPFLENNAVQSIQEEEVLSLKVCCSKYNFIFVHKFTVYTVQCYNTLYSANLNNFTLVKWQIVLNCMFLLTMLARCVTIGV